MQGNYLIQMSYTTLVSLLMCIQVCQIHILMIASDLQSLVKIVLNNNAELLHCLWEAFAQTV